jgi:hypothetical protein
MRSMPNEIDSCIPILDFADRLLDSVFLVLDDRVFVVIASIENGYLDMWSVGIRFSQMLLVTS